MKFPALTILVVITVVFIASGGVAPKESESVARDPASANSTAPGVLPAKSLIGPLTPEETGYEPVTVPEPVLASVLAACAVILVRRGRSY
jgi:hypothetical protein